MTLPVTRRLSPRELATVRAALELWMDTPAEWIPEQCHEAIDGVGLLSDREIAQFLLDLAVADDVTVGGVTT